ncbi:uncharacterized protein LOC134251027 [Saccostrea cucullata]|uniref:uncharacterized protein LOC134251027 n=1 Tax=Saccostrea cuccullata TaxID=36930 RepID=UPI002ED66CF2
MDFDENIIEVWDGSNLIPQSETEAEETEPTASAGDNKSDVKCCVYLMTLFSFGLVSSTILCLRFLSDLSKEVHGDTEYLYPLCPILTTIAAAGNFCYLVLVIATFLKSGCKGKVIVSVQKLFFLVLGFFTIASFLAEAFNSENSCPLLYIILCCTFTTIQTFYLCSSDSHFLQIYKLTSVAFSILMAVNLCIWLDTETEEIYNIFHISDSGNFSSNATGNAKQKSLYDDISDAIDPFSTPLKIEYFLMALELLTSKLDDKNPTCMGRTHSNEVVTNRNCLQKILLKLNDKQQIKFTIKGIFCFLIFLFVLFAIIVVIVKPKPGELNMKVYHVYCNTEFGFEILQFLFLLIVIIATYPWFWQANMHLDTIVFSICAFANISYNFFSCFGAFSIRQNVGGANAILVMLNTFLQTTYLVVLNHNENKETYQQHLGVMFFLLAINNLAFWMVDSLAQERYPPFTYSSQKFYNDIWWKIFNKIVFPLVIFYRFKAAMYFFEMETKEDTCTKDMSTQCDSDTEIEDEETVVKDTS